ncbi:glycoside hydrolase family protein [Kaistia granuli]|uniref:glycoside hydrolase family protein n=1 Tax=Kaistia granuli TaxID=363259 RepID=UPI00037E8D13|nr:peptidoglycan-binding protein [Kaistia granuli]
MTRTSPAGLEQLVAEEGEVLRAYRDVAGVWTIGVGLTAASGVIVPKAGMTITRAQSRALLAEALTSRYEPAVAAAMPGALGHEFDGGVSFHFNTGAIARASWVRAWHNSDRAALRAGLATWNKAGGRVVEGLSRRRAREADLILDGRRDTGVASFATLSRGDSGERVGALQGELIRLGVLATEVDGSFGAATEAAVRAFQSAHPQLTVDGRVGPATQAQITRSLAARDGLAATAASGTLVTGGVATAGHTAPAVLFVAGLLFVALGVLAWRYRDEIRAILTLKRRH